MSAADLDCPAKQWTNTAPPVVLSSVVVLLAWLIKGAAMVYAAKRSASGSSYNGMVKYWKGDELLKKLGTTQVALRMCVMPWWMRAL